MALLGTNGSVFKSVFPNINVVLEQADGSDRQFVQQWDMRQLLRVLRLVKTVGAATTDVLYKAVRLNSHYLSHLPIWVWIGQLHAYIPEGANINQLLQDLQHLVASKTRTATHDVELNKVVDDLQAFAKRTSILHAAVLRLVEPPTCPCDGRGAKLTEADKGHIIWQLCMGVATSHLHNCAQDDFSYYQFVDMFSIDRRPTYRALYKNSLLHPFLSFDNPGSARRSPPHPGYIDFS